MQYDRKINTQLEKINTILFSFKQKDILNNPDYEIDNMSCEWYLKIHFNKKNHLYFSIIISKDGIDINIDRMIETVSLTYDEVCEKGIIEDLLFLFYFSKIIVEYIGDNNTNIQFFDENNSLKKTIKDPNGVSFSMKFFTKKKEIHEYFPIVKKEIITINYLTNNRLIINIPKQEITKWVEVILNYLHYDTSLFYYLFFGYREFNKEITEYVDIYPQLANDKGFINLEEKDIRNISFIIDIMNEFQMASLFINRIPDLEKKYEFQEIRDSTSLFEGYVIRELKYGFIDVLKDNSLPQWENLIHIVW